MTCLPSENLIPSGENRHPVHTSATKGRQKCSIFSVTDTVHQHNRCNLTGTLHSASRKEAFRVNCCKGNGWKATAVKAGRLSRPCFSCVISQSGNAVHKGKCLLHDAPVVCQPLSWGPGYMAQQTNPADCQQAQDTVFSQRRN